MGDRRRRNIEVEVEELRASLEEQCYDREAIVEICRAKREKLLRKLDKPNATQDSDDEAGDAMSSKDGGSRQGSPQKEADKLKSGDAPTDKDEKGKEKEKTQDKEKTERSAK